jgi:hypothetical protein
MDRTRLKPWQRLFGETKRPSAIEKPQIQELPPFSYSPLAPGTIRLLVADPHSHSAGHAWQLQTVHLDGKLQFDALSYTWGPQDQTFPISLNGQCAYVHHNLHTALPYLAARSKRRFRRQPIWIDAICINQADEKEKGVQIASMHQIYRLAKTVWAWLGLAEEQALMPKAVALLNKIAYAGSGPEKDKPAAGREVLDILGLDGLDPAVWGAIKHLLQNPWFRRVWVMQEAALAERIIFICGQYEIGPMHMRQTIRSAACLEFYDASGNIVDLDDAWYHAAIFDIRDTVQYTPGLDEYTGEASMLMEVSYLMANNNHKCLLPEDRVRGMLGLCRTSAVSDLKLHDSLDVPTLYTIFSKHLLTSVDPSGRWWSWFGLALGFSRRQGLPSWVPDLHQQEERNLCEVFMRSLPYHYGLSRPVQASNKKASATPGERLDELLLKGRIIDEVVMAHEEIPPKPPAEEGGDYVEVFRYLCQIADWEKSLSAWIPSESIRDNSTEKRAESKTRQDIMELFWEALIGEFLKTAPGPTTRESYRYFRVETKEVREMATKYPITGAYVTADAIFRL